MMNSESIKGYNKLKYIYKHNMSVDLLSEVIDVCHLNDDALEIKKLMLAKDYDVYGVQKDGEIVGYVSRDKLKAGQIKEFYVQFKASDLITNSTSLIDLLNIFKNKDFIFILEKNSVERMVTKSDLHKQPIRMLVFSLISLLEMYLISVIQEYYSDDSWENNLTSERINKAKSLLEKRKLKNEALTLLDCTQLSDKGAIVRKTPKLAKGLGFNSNNQLKSFFKELEELRNNTAHSQELIYNDDQELIKLILELNELLDDNMPE